MGIMQIGILIGFVVAILIALLREAYKKPFHLKEDSLDSRETWKLSRVIITVIVSGIIGGVLGGVIGFFVLIPIQH